jgi:hypothetical protein
VRRELQTALPLALALALVFFAGCKTVEPAVVVPPPPSEEMATGDRVYRVDRLRFQVPGEWEARGGPRLVALEAPDQSAQLQVESIDSRAANEDECLAHAEAALERGASGLTNVRRHQTSLGGRRALTQEADMPNAWHGWAYALCDGPTEYRLFFAGKTPLPPPAMDTFQKWIASVRLEGTKR